MRQLHDLHQCDVIDRHCNAKDQKIVQKTINSGAVARKDKSRCRDQHHDHQRSDCRIEKAVKKRLNKFSAFDYDLKVFKYPLFWQAQRHRIRFCLLLKGIQKDNEQRNQKSQAYDNRDRVQQNSRSYFFSFHNAFSFGSIAFSKK